ncbi:MAG TPA: hypothetical protein VG942_15755 [Hyphomonadaceae bacterium]|nr:hypothetical protein [Hyphomonadaceae bacterium]
MGLLAAPAGAAPPAKCKTIAECSKALSADPNNPVMHLWMGDAYYNDKLTMFAGNEYKLAADQGNIQAAAYYADLLKNNQTFLGTFQEAEKYASIAANGGNTLAMFMLGDLHYYTAYGMVNDSVAASWYARALLQPPDKDVPADSRTITAKNMGDIYMNSASGMRNYTTAAAYLQMAVIGGDVWSMSELGSLYTNSQYGMLNYQKGNPLLQQAANGGDGWAMYNLGLSYCWGRGLAQNTAQAQTLWNNARAKGRETNDDKLVSWANNNLSYIGQCGSSGNNGSAFTPTPPPNVNYQYDRGVQARDSINQQTYGHQ